MVSEEKGKSQQNTGKRSQKLEYQLPKDQDVDIKDALAFSENQSSSQRVAKEVSIQDLKSKDTQECQKSIKNKISDAESTEKPQVTQKAKYTLVKSQN